MPAERHLMDQGTRRLRPVMPCGARGRRCADVAAEGVGLAEADIVEQDHQDVRRALRQAAR
jgi:hypothetical protein